MTVMSAKKIKVKRNTFVFDAFCCVIGGEVIRSFHIYLVLIMPKVQKDDALHTEIQAIVALCGGLGKAEKALQINRATLWRFCKSGCAIDRTRQQLEVAAKRYRSETNNFVSRQEKKMPASDELRIDQLRKIRAFCQSMITFVDAFESTLGLAVDTHAAAQ
ncbi:hypothetical protein [Duganella sacchari]|nr:hypothetical protein [Duganella sacchari]